MAVEEIKRSHNKPIVALVENGVQVKELLVEREVIFFDRYDELPALQTAFEHFRSQVEIERKN